MTGLVRKATFFVACAALLGAAAAYAGIVSPGNCSVTRSENGAVATRINLVGYNVGGPAGSQADSLELNSKIIVTVRDVSNNPIAGVPVVLDFSGCTGDVKVGNFQSFHQIATNSCAGVTVLGYSTTNGTATFTIVGGRTGSVAHAAGCAKVYADSYLLASLGVGTFDQTNSGGFTLADISFFWVDANGGLNPDRSDVDGNGFVTLADVGNAWVVNGHASSFNTSSAVLCP